ncbi:UNVERIFIED_ORG: hypothetical protein ABRZ91_000859 [Heyndrickxia coagulans]
MSNHSYNLLELKQDVAQEIKNEVQVMKKLASILLMLLTIGVISGCSLFTKEVDYKKVAKDLSEKNMNKIMNATNSYANFEQDYSLVSSYELNKSKEKKEETNEIYIDGVYDTRNHTALGNAQKSIKSEVHLKNDKENKNNEEKNSPEFKIKYEQNKFIDANSKKPLKLQFLANNLQGIEGIKPKDYFYGLDEPPSVYYNLSEEQFNKILNDDLKIKYDKFKDATILIVLQEGEGKKLFITEIDITVSWQKRNKDGRVIQNNLYYSLYLTDENSNAKKKFDSLRKN